MSRVDNDGVAVSFLWLFFRRDNCVEPEGRVANCRRFQGRGLNNMERADWWDDELSQDMSNRPNPWGVICEQQKREVTFSR